MPTTCENAENREMERAKGFEPSPQNPQHAEPQPVTNDSETGYTQPRAQITGNDWRDLSQVVAAWGELPGALKAAIIAIVDSVRIKGGQ
jgi:hypothetical protein